LKYMPDMVFIHDPSLEEGRSMEALFNKLKKESANGPEQT